MAHNNTPLDTVITEQEAKALAFRWMQILDDCTRLVDTTINPDVFFSRYECMADALTQLSSIEMYINFTGKPSDALKKARDPQYYEMQINTFINRSFDKLMLDASKLKTEKGRAIKINNFFSEMEQYKNNMSTANLFLLDNLKQHSQN